MSDPVGGGGAGVSFIAVFCGAICSLVVGLGAQLLGVNNMASAILATVAFLVGAFLAGRWAYRTLAGK